MHPFETYLLYDLWQKLGKSQNVALTHSSRQSRNFGNNFVAKTAFLHKKVPEAITLTLGTFFSTCPKEEANPLSRVKIDHAKWVAQYPDSD